MQQIESFHTFGDSLFTDLEVVSGKGTALHLRTGEAYCMSAPRLR